MSDPKETDALLWLDDGNPSQKDQLIDSLQRDLNDERDRRKEERFIWLVVVMVVFDAFAFQSMQTWTGPLLIGLIQILLLIVMGRRWQIDEIWSLTERILDKWDGRLGGGG